MVYCARRARCIHRALPFVYEVSSSSEGNNLMSTNVSGLDRVIRVVIAIAAVAIAFAVGASSVLGIILFVVAAIMLVTAATGFCPLYRLFGLSTKKAAV